MKISLLKSVGLTLLVGYSANALSDTSNAYAVPVGLLHAVTDAKERGLKLDLPYCLKYNEIDECAEGMAIGKKVEIDDAELARDTQYAFKVKSVDGVLSGNVFQSFKSYELTLGEFEISDEAVFVIGGPPKGWPAWWWSQ